MAVPKKTLDLSSWNQFLQQERSSDYEYNLLLYKFRSFLKEVEEYCETHKYCSITRSSNDLSSSTSLSNHQNSHQQVDYNHLQQHQQQQHHHHHQQHQYPQSLNTNSHQLSISSINSSSLTNNGQLSLSNLSQRSHQIKSTPPLYQARPSLRHQNSTPICEDISNNSNEYSNYVNIDFFLKRRNSPSFEEVYDDPNNDDPDEREEHEEHKVHKVHQDNEEEEDEEDVDEDDEDDDDDDDDTEDNDINDDCIANENQRNVHENGNNNNLNGNEEDTYDDNSLQLHHQIDLNGNALVAAHNTMRSFLSDLNLSSVDNVFEDKAQRRIVKESFAVEYCGKRKLRHLFLFNDVIVCAKYQASSKQKFTFDVKWYLTLNGVSIIDPDDINTQIKYDKEAIENLILDTRTNLMLLRSQMQQMKRSKHKQPIKLIKKLKKKRTELEAQLVLLLPHLPLVIKHINGKKYTFFMSSNFDRNQWIDSIKFLQSQLTSSKGTLSAPSSNELQAWIQTCRKNLNPSLGTFLLRSNCDDDLLYGDIYLNLLGIDGLNKGGNYYFCFEVDSYGHFFQKASSPVLNLSNDNHHSLNEEHIFPLDGAHTLRILMYLDHRTNMKPSLAGKAQLELSHACFMDQPVEKTIIFNSNCSLKVRFSYSSSELVSMRIPHTKLCPIFAMDITQVCKKEKTSVPMLIQLCVNEVERRGMRETGIYRMSGTSTDVQKLKKAFETNPYVAELLLRDIDINSVTGFLKTYLREMPEGLFSNKLHSKFVAAFNIPQTESLERTQKLLELFRKIPITNQNTIIYLVEHLVKVNRYETFNKMSLANLATVLGPNILRHQPSDHSTQSNSSSDPFTAVVIGSMAQAGILYFFLNRKYCNLPLTELDSSEMARSQTGTMTNIKSIHSTDVLPGI